MIKVSRLLALITLTFIISFSAISQDIKRFKKHVSVLAADDMMGRDSKRPEIWRAADYISNRYKSIGLDKYDENGYHQRFIIPDTNIETANIIGIIRAKEVTTESIIFTAHYDGLGIKKTNAQGDSIYNGAVDNAVGVAALLELAATFNKGKKPKKNLVFIATSAEEIGLFGSTEYLANPSFPAAGISFVLNIDGFNIYGKTDDIRILPRKGIAYYNTIAKIAVANGFEDATPDWVDDLNTNFDSSVFLAESIPAITIWTGDKIRGMTSEEARNFRFSISRNYHSPDDEVTDKWNWNGIKDHFRVYKKIAEYYLNNKDRETVTQPDLFKNNN